MRLIGRGGMSTVYVATDLIRSIDCAIKVMDEELAIDHVFVRRFTREAQALSKLQHPNIVRFYNLEREGSIFYMVLDYIEGKSLKKLIHESSTLLPESEILSVIRQVCSALQYAHHMGYIHCDLKPENILLDVNNHVYLSDFGITRLMDSGTTTLVGAGTPAYMAPELVLGKDPSIQTDIYSLGVILYEMFTGGERPFTGEFAKTGGSTSAKVIWEQVNTIPPSPRAFNKNISLETETIILMCLEKDPRKRFGNVQELLSKLDRSLNRINEESIGNSNTGEIYPPLKKNVVKTKNSRRILSKGTPVRKIQERKPISLPVLLIIITIVIILPVLIFSNIFSSSGALKIPVISNTQTPTIGITSPKIGTGSLAGSEYDSGMKLVSHDTFMSGSNELLIGTGWYAKNEQFLNQNLSVMKWFFSIDGEIIPEQSIVEKAYQSQDQYPGIEKAFFVEGWPIGIHQIKSGYTLDKKINDGFFDFAAGDYIEDFTINVLPLSNNTNYTSWNRVYFENFSNQNKDWININDPENISKNTVEIKNGKLLLGLAKTNENSFDLVTPSTNIIGDFLIKAKLQNIAGNISQDCYGIGFHSSYSFSICNTQNYSVGDTNGETYQVIKDWTSSSSINTSSPNEVWILRKGLTYSLFINGSKISEFDSKEKRMESFYFFGQSFDGSAATFEFDDVELMMP
jgi:serine/threonine protein kinase